MYPSSAAVAFEAMPLSPIVNVAARPSAMLPVTGTMFVASADEVRTLSVSSVVGSDCGERVLYGRHPPRTCVLSASEKKIWVV